MRILSTPPRSDRCLLPSASVSSLRESRADREAAEAESMASWAAESEAAVLAWGRAGGRGGLAIGAVRAAS